MRRIDEPALLEVEQLLKRFKQVTAVDGVSFTIAKGTCFGLLGPNGAGKTTTIEVIEDILPPTAGQIYYKGRVRSASFREEIGIQFQQTALLSFLTVRETLETMRCLYRRRRNVDELIAECNLQDIQDRLNDKISGGQRQRMLLALALVNDPELLFLDEPSTGLDPQARHNLWDLIQGIKYSGKTIVLTTHYMEEAQFLCDEVAIMDQGRIIASGSPRKLIEEHGGRATLVLPRSSVPAELPPVCFKPHLFDQHVEISVSDLNACLQQLLQNGVDVSKMTVRSPNLEDVFLNLTGRHLRV